MEVLTTVKSNLKKHGNYSTYIDREFSEKTILIKNSGYGEMALLFALVHPDKKIMAYEENEEKNELAKYAAEGIVKNTSFQTRCEYPTNNTDGIIVYDCKML